jgi:hypothetical protein
LLLVIFEFAMWPCLGASKHPNVVSAAVLITAVAFLLLPATKVSAQSIDQQADEAQTNYGWRETWGGVDAARDQWLLYSGMTVAPWSRDIYSDGWRLRVGGGYGEYGYDSATQPQPCGVAVVNDLCANGNHLSNRHFRVEHAYAEMLIGYYLRLGELTAKAFAGASMSSEHHLIQDPNNHDDGTEYGAKGALELWLNVSQESWTSLDLSYATARNETSSRWRTGWRVEPGLSIGPELRYDKNVETGEGDWNGRAGLFVRCDWVGGEVSLAGGVSGRVEEWNATEVSPYGTFNVLFQY